MTSFKARKILITGGAGFIGSEFVRQGVEKGYNIVVVDKLTYAGSLERLEPVKGKYKFYKSDICDNAAIDSIFDKEKPEAIVHFAAETHVDRSISGPGEFVRTNVLGTYVMLEAAKKAGVGKFVHVSTDEVYGSLGEDDAPFTEETPLAPNSPYSASKASSDFLARAYYKTFGQPVIITRCSNNYGPYQCPEKLIPLMITNALANKSLPVYGNGRNIRDWIYVKDHCAAVYSALNKGKNGEVYNIGGSNEWTNIDIVEKICKILDDTVPLPGSSKSYKSLITFVKDRLGHDWRYAIDSGKIIRELGWKPETDFEKGIEATVRWYSSADIRDKI